MLSTFVGKNEFLQQKEDQFKIYLQEKQRDLCFE